MIEILDKNRVRVASHQRRYSVSENRYSTDVAHMPRNHQVVHLARQFDGGRYRNWAANIGENAYFIIDNLLTAGKAEEQGYKSCMGILQFSKKYGDQRLEAACKRARSLGSCTYSTVGKILKNGLENAASGTPKPTPGHENIRGSEYYS